MFCVCVSHELKHLSLVAKPKIYMNPRKFDGLWSSRLNMRLGLDSKNILCCTTSMIEVKRRAGTCLPRSYILCFSHTMAMHSTVWQRCHAVKEATENIWTSSCTSDFTTTFGTTLPRCESAGKLPIFMILFLNLSNQMISQTLIVIPTR